jgi:hypothetical protein
MRPGRVLGFGLFALGLVIAFAAALGPFVAGMIRYHTSDTALNQIVGGDAAALLIIAPACFVIGVLALRGNPAAAPLALAPSVYAGYTYTQLIVGEEYLRLPGNNERYFPLLYLGFLTGLVVAVMAWRQTGPAALPQPSRRLEHTGAVVLFAVVVFLAAQHVPGLVDAVRGHPTRVEYVSSPTAFWVVKLMDLGLVAPAALVTGIGLTRGSPWARRPMYALIGAYTMLGAAVSGMAITMYANHDPDASWPVVAGFSVLTLAFAALTFALYRAPSHRRPDTAGRPLTAAPR